MGKSLSSAYQFYQTDMSTEAGHSYLYNVYIQFQNMIPHIDSILSKDMTNLLDSLGMRQFKLEQKFNTLFMCFILFTFTVSILFCVLFKKNRKNKMNKYIQVKTDVSEKTIDI